MSGVTLAVAPEPQPSSSSITSKQSSTTTQTPQKQSISQQQPQALAGGVMGSLRLIELQLVAFIMVFSASGLVPLLDLIFPAFASTYFIILSRFTFPTTNSSKPSTSSSSPEIFTGGTIFRLYVIIGTTIGLFLPLAYVLGGFARGDDHAVRSATPHLFLLSFQILTENVISGLSLFSPPVRALVPMLYTVRRIFVIIDWMTDVWVSKMLPSNAAITDVVWFWFGRSLAAANLLYFSLNLFGFLIPQFLPRAFEKYFRENGGEVYAKMKEDKRFSSSSSDAAAVVAESHPDTSKKTA